MAFLIVGTGFVADLYMRSLKTFGEEGKVAMAYDLDKNRLEQFCTYWDVPKAESLDQLLSSFEGAVILNLTNPKAHYEVTKQALQQGRHVFSEKPLALTMKEAQELYNLAAANQVYFASAPSSVLGTSARTLCKAVQDGMIGTPRLVYAELDDNFISDSPFQKWKSESGAPWPYKDEFQVGCTFEHAGYYLTWLIAMFGQVLSVSAFSSNLVLSEKFPEIPNQGPDYSCASLLFKSGIVARLTCSVIANHNHRIQVIGDRGVLSVNEAWNNQAKVYLQKRFILRRRLINSPFKTRLRPYSDDGMSKVKRWGAASMNFALGPIEMLRSIKASRACTLSAAFALHLNEVTLAVHTAGKNSVTQHMTTCCESLFQTEALH
jgi:predicted dehydrogenase